MSRHLLLGITGGIAAYKSAELTRLFNKAGYTVQVAMSEAATHFVGPVTFQGLSGRPVFVDQWDARISNNMPHIDLSRAADAILIAPASADFIAKLANGLCDDLLSTLCAARDCPLLIAPAMNRQMWENPANQRNIALLQQDGVVILGPGNGDQACGEVGDGRMLEPEALFELTEGVFQPKSLAGKQVLITAGPTFEPIDAVRGITNISSGKMGYAVARAAVEAGARVTLISGPTALAAPLGCLRVDVNTAQQMLDAVLAHVGKADIFIGVAAVADYAVKNRSEHKIKKSDANLSIELTPNPDILATVASLPAAPFCVGFAAESQHVLQYADEKRRRKKVPLLVANLAQAAFGADDNEITLLDDAGHHPLPKASKQVLARELIQHIARMITPHA
ncbi:phosphopantothenoylcysteine decarboxylase/phosphopantothenate--cysteine ligase [Chitinivorax tropicus]|uniref:Coenzyme A biosynthesis bifunctional protein CoaBC n=1 Tax=Chitinivorax tropicus TaxID=714531 RepID=A0A840ML29_9PROT|nr:bifunctional phosphopantothenoylcysteine decarboxylase/phosphopantothenate--cysteine ligase CoaBC [Chitinivorax tropicus]MBB5019120.1 phosphopantothenoylcysteine decarboxylase/phosphopantothenate--cysteine ligase [Chitinivorax tropicus]